MLEVPAGNIHAVHASEAHPEVHSVSTATAAKIQPRLVAKPAFGVADQNVPIILVCIVEHVVFLVHQVRLPFVLGLLHPRIRILGDNHKLLSVEVQEGRPAMKSGKPKTTAAVIGAG